MESIQLSFEIATSISIIGAALTFLWSQIGQSKKARVLAIRQQRIEQMSKLIADFAVLLVKGDVIVEKVKHSHKESEFYVSIDDFSHFCCTIERYIRINSFVLFEVWATAAEKKALQDIKVLVEDWRAKFLDDAKENENAELIDFEWLLIEIGVNVKKLSALLKNDVKKFHS